MCQPLRHVFVLTVVLAAGSASALSAQAAPVPPDGSAPVTPSVRPTLANTADVQRALMEAYPVRLRDAGIGGAPLVWIHITADGSVDRAEVQQSSGVEPLDAAALEVARAMRFVPARDDVGPIAMWILIPIRFQVMR